MGCCWCWLQQLSMMTEQQQQQQEPGVVDGWYDLCGWWSCQQEKLVLSACWSWWQPDTAALEPLPSVLLLTSPPASVAAVHAVPAAACGPLLAGLAVPAAGELPQAAAWELQCHGGFHCLGHHCGQ